MGAFINGVYHEHVEPPETARDDAKFDGLVRALRLATDMLEIEAKSHRDAQRTRCAIAVEGCIERCRTVLRAAEANLPS